MSDQNRARYKRAAMALALTAGAVTINASAVTAATALPAATCSQAAPTAAENPYSTVHTALDAAPLRVAPYEKCTRLQTYAAGSSIRVSCYIVNDYGNTWSYVRGAGWVWDNHLSGGGSPHPCVF